MVPKRGCPNWDRDYRAMARAFHAHVASHRALAAGDLAACLEVVRALTDDPECSKRLKEWAVQWVQRNPEPILLEPPKYKR